MAAPQRIKTRRLTLSALSARDAHGVSRALNHFDVVRNTATVPYPLTPFAAADWIADQPWHNGAGLRYAIRRWGRIVGTVGLGGRPATVGYMVSPKVAGRGFATEATRAVLRDAFQRRAARAVLATVFDDNPASIRVLRKLGFAKVGEDQQVTRHRPEGGLLHIYRVTAEGLT